MKITPASLLAAGREAWPTIDLTPEVVAAHLDAHAKRGNVVMPEHATDFYLACACASGNEAAARVLDEIVRTGLVKAVARIDARPAFVDDALQALRVKLLMGDSPKIGTYSGKSALRKWLGTAAVRTALNLQRGKENEKREGLTSTIGQDVARGPELAYVRERYRDAFEGALRAALGQLSERERVLLRMNVVERMGVDRLARVYGCGRSTVARWLATARDNVLVIVRAQLRDQLGVTPSEVESLAAALRSDLDVSMARLLDPTPSA